MSTRWESKQINALKVHSAHFNYMYICQLHNSDTDVCDSFLFEIYFYILYAVYHTKTRVKRIFLLQFSQGNSNYKHSILF